MTNKRGKNNKNLSRLQNFLKKGKKKSLYTTTLRKDPFPDFIPTGTLKEISIEELDTNKKSKLAGIIFKLETYKFEDIKLTDTWEIGWLERLSEMNAEDLKAFKDSLKNK